MKRCPICGSSQPSSARFCTACGKPLKETLENPFRGTEDDWNGIGDTVNLNHNGTGADYEDYGDYGRQDYDPPRAPKKKKGGKAKFIIIPIAAILVIVAIVEGVLIWRGQSDSSTSDTAQSQEESIQPTGSLGGLFEEDSQETETAAAEESALPTDTAQPAESPAQEETDESLTSDVWTPVNQTSTDTSTQPEGQEATTVTHTYDGVTINGDYVFSDSDSRYLSESELYSLTRQELDIARNEIFARRGRIFQTDSFRVYFESCSWYTPLYEQADFDRLVTLNAYEQANSALIREYEIKMGYIN